MKAILLKFKVFSSHDFSGKEREYSDILLNPKNITCVYEETDTELNQKYTVIEFDRKSIARHIKSPISSYKTEETLHSVLERVNMRQAIKTAPLPSI